MFLTPEQIRAIIHHVETDGVFIETLKDDLVDHLCCVIEQRMLTGLTFESAFCEALQDLAPSGLKEIQTQTTHLLYPKILIMKKIMYLLGLSTTISMTMGLMFKILHMPGGEELFNYGFFAFAFLFLPTIAIKKFRQHREWPLYEKIKTVFGFISTIGVACAVLMKISMQLEISGIILLASVSIFCFGFLPFLFYDLYRDSLKSSDKEDQLEDQLL